MFIAFEGIDGAGKTTQVALLQQRLGQTSRTPVHVVHEPGGTPLGEAVGLLVKHTPELELTPQSELLLFLASRSQLVRRVIRPALEAGDLVVCDRFSASTLAYQGYGRGLDLGLVRQLVAFSSGGLAPDLTILLSVPVSVGLNRKKSDGRHSAGPLQPTMFDTTSYDRFHDEEQTFHERVHQGYFKIAGDAEGNWVVIDGTPAPEQVFSHVWKAVQPLVGG